MTNQDPARRVTGTLSVGGDLTGQAAIGSDIRQDLCITSSDGPTEAELADLRSVVEQVRAAILEKAPPDLEAAARERADELADAVLQDQPDLSALEYLRNWFGRRIPSVAGAFTTLVFNPVLGKLVAAGGDSLVKEFQRRFGG